MTRDEILALEGEELDKLVAEKVMEWHIESTSEWSDPHWVDANGHYAAGINKNLRFKKLFFSIFSLPDAVN